MANSKQIKISSIVIAVLVALIVIFAMLNWKSSISIDSKPFENFKQAQAPKNITIYYYPSRKRAADALTYYFAELDYKVVMYPASKLERLKASKNAPSYVFFNQEQFSQAMAIKSKVEKVLNAPVNAYRFKSYQEDPAIMMVFTDA